MISMGAASEMAGRARGLSRPAVSALGGLSAQKDYLTDWVTPGAARRRPTNQSAVNGSGLSASKEGSLHDRNLPQPPHYFIGKTADASHMSVQRFLPDLYDMTGGGLGELRSNPPPFSFKTEAA